ncbi:hypothetical protein CDAR_504701 [Caerostris darwini]|uniref:Uncharacterized protein n=1 Tax=Caerostris darwini TaxID=1538125 RepID=A0AAV4SF77_9ARAC|nr:hypothetical protein CDAR_504701 [Caerostris darwini]
MKKRHQKQGVVVKGIRGILQNAKIIPEDRPMEVFAQTDREDADCLLRRNPQYVSVNSDDNEYRGLQECIIIRN